MSNKQYFTQDTENAIIKYNQTQDDIFRNNIFETEIYPAFLKLSENVMNTFKLSSYSDTDFKTLQQEAVSHMTQQLPKYKDDIGKKAFSYFTIICKYWMIHRNKKNYENTLRYVEIGEDAFEEEGELSKKRILVAPEPIDESYIEHLRELINYTESNLDYLFKPKDCEIARAIIEIFKIQLNDNNITTIPYTKHMFFNMVRDICGKPLPSQPIKRVMNVFIKEYQRIKYENQKD